MQKKIVYKTLVEIILETPAMDGKELDEALDAKGKEVTIKDLKEVLLSELPNDALDGFTVKSEVLDSSLWTQEVKTNG